MVYHEQYANLYPSLLSKCSLADFLAVAVAVATDMLCYVSSNVFHTFFGASTDSQSR